jgi:hypothetical protein
MSCIESPIPVLSPLRANRRLVSPGLGTATQLRPLQLKEIYSDLLLENFTFLKSYSVSSVLHCGLMYRQLSSLVSHISLTIISRGG